MALKIKFPNRIYMLRGNHEDEETNEKYGFEKECTSRLKEVTSREGSVFKTINHLFRWLPLCAVV